MLRLQFRDDPQRSITLSATVTVGRDESNDLVIDDPGVSDFHAEISIDGDRPVIIDLLSAGGTFVNEQRIGAATRLRGWDRVRLGAVELEVNDPNARRPGEWALRNESALLASQFHALKPRTVVGRDADCDLTIDSGLLSRHHAELTLESEGVRVRDLGSANGTFLNGSPVQEALARPGDELRFDQQAFIVEGPDLEPGGRGSATGDHTLRRDSATHDELFPEHTVLGALAAPIDETRAMTLETSPLGYLREETGALQPPLIELAERSYTLGRGADSDIALADSSVSKRHARLHLERGRWHIADLGSRNGVRINGRVVEEAGLSPGDHLKIGRLEFTFSGPDPALDPDGTEGAGQTARFAPPPAAAGAGRRRLVLAALGASLAALLAAFLVAWLR